MRMSERYHERALARHLAEIENQEMMDIRREQMMDEIYPQVADELESYDMCIREEATPDLLKAMRQADKLDDAIEFLRLFRIAHNKYCDSVTKARVEEELRK